MGFKELILTLSLAVLWLRSSLAQEYVYYPASSSAEASYPSNYYYQRRYDQPLLLQKLTDRSYDYRPVVQAVEVVKKRKRSKPTRLFVPNVWG